jgi:hypothetical protein
MGRKPIYKKGAMTDAERQRRRRRKQRQLKRKEERHELAVKNKARWAGKPPCGSSPEEQAKWLAEEVVWHTLYGQPPLPGAAGLADELVRQIAEFMAQEPEVTVSDVRAALERRYGPA